MLHNASGIRGQLQGMEAPGSLGALGPIALGLVNHALTAKDLGPFGMIAYIVAVGQHHVPDTPPVLHQAHDIRFCEFGLRPAFRVLVHGNRGQSANGCQMPM